ncbi:MAG: prepilin-type N-terminal cleavage/methylation domain-containing protein [Nannocystaceae bacterium]
MSRAGQRRGVCGTPHGGFTLLEVLIAVAILAVSLSSLFGSQLASLRATQYARGLTAAAFLAEYQLLEIQETMRKDGWIENDKRYEGDFAEQGWPSIRYVCMVDFIELPEFNRLLEAKTDADEADGEAEPVFQDSDDQAFSALGMVWPIAKGAIENSIRKADCTAFWSDGEIEHDVRVATFWAEAERLRQLPGMGGEATDEDDAPPSGSSPPGAGGAKTKAGRGSSRGRGGRKGGR